MKKKEYGYQMPVYAMMPNMYPCMMMPNMYSYMMPGTLPPMPYPTSVPPKNLYMMPTPMRQQDSEDEEEMMPWMTPGMMPGMPPGMMPGMPPGMMPGMTPGMPPGGMPSDMIPMAPGFMMPFDDEEMEGMGVDFDSDFFNVYEEDEEE